MKRKWPCGVTTSVSIASRVVPATSLTMTRGSPTIALKSEDLPALGRPTMATGTVSAPSPSPSSAASLARKLLEQVVEQVADAQAVDRRDGHGFAQPEPVEVGRSALCAGSSSLLAMSTTGTPARRSTAAISWSSATVAGAAVDHEEHEVGLRRRPPRPARGSARRRARPRSCRSRPCRPRRCAVRPIRPRRLCGRESRRASRGRPWCASR